MKNIQYNQLIDYRINKTSQCNGGEYAEHVMNIRISNQTCMNPHAIKYRNGNKTEKAGVNEKMASHNFGKFKLLYNKIRKSKRQCKNHRVCKQYYPPRYEEPFE